MCDKSAASMVDHEQFALDLAASAPTHEAWLAIVNYGLPTLLKNPCLFMEIITREAERMLANNKISSRKTSDEAAQIMRELNLRFEVID